MKWLVISRAEKFSPNAVGRDNAILQSVAALLRNAGNEVELVKEADVSQQKPNADVVISMARSSKALVEESMWGMPVVNSPSGVGLCSNRFSLTQTLAHIGMSAASSLSCILSDFDSILSGVNSSFGFPCWLKRGDGCTESAADTVFCNDEKDLRKAVSNFFSRKIQSLVVTRHVKGDLIKFYSVAGTPFFNYSYPTANGKSSKFGLERYNDAAKFYGFNSNRLKSECDEFMSQIEVPVYGGDAIVCPDGHYEIIDLNDWPSFSSCREEAAKAIYQYLTDNYDQDRIH